MSKKAEDKARAIYRSNKNGLKKALLDEGYRLSDEELHQITCFISLKYIEDIIKLIDVRDSSKDFYKRVKEAFIETIIT